jgi:hypothetical protein
MLNAEVKYRIAYSRNNLNSAIHKFFEREFVLNSLLSRL